MPRMYKFFRQGVRLELRPLKGQRKGPASGEAAGPGRKMPMPWWRAWGRDLRGREEKAPRLGGIRCWPVCRPFLKESFTSCKELAGPASGEAAGPGRKMPMPWWRAWGRDLRGREEKADRFGGIRCWAVWRPVLKERFPSYKELAGPASGEAAGPGRKMPMPWWRAWGRDLR